MINTTQQPILTTKDFSAALRNAFRAYGDHLKITIGPEDAAKKGSKAIYRAFNVFTPDLLVDNIDAEYLVDLCDYSLFYLDQHRKDLIKRVYRGTQSKTCLAADNLGYVRRQIRFALYKMWSDGDLVLPVTFSLANSLTRQQVIDLSPKLGRFCREFPNEASGRQHPLSYDAACLSVVGLYDLAQTRGHRS